MARLARLAVDGGLQHVLQRGIQGAPIFRDAADFAQMRELLHDTLRRHGTALHAYVLMPDHFHLLLTPAEGGRLGPALQAIGRSHVRRFNLRHRRSGPLWAGRFRSTLADPDSALLDLMRYVEGNPQRAGLVPEGAVYPWSSLAHHLGQGVDPLIEDHRRFWDLGNTPFERQAAYARLAAQPLEAGRLEKIRHAAHHGWPLGTDAFLADLAQRTVRPLAPRPRGRPRGSRLAAAPNAAGGAVPNLPSRSGAPHA
jgi:putative transposase